MAFNIGSLSDASQLVSSVAGGANAISNFASNVSSASSLLDFAKDGRMGGALSGLAEGAGDLMGAISSFSDNTDPADWRVRLSLAKWTSFKSSPVLKPLSQAGGLIFPYTPQVQFQSSASYSKIDTTHTNYTFQAFKNSDPGSISITAPMNVEDSTQALYWIAAVHYLRSLTKMFTGSDPKAGNPPPIIFLNGYGNYLFKNVPVVVTNFTCTLPNDCDYIGCNVVGSMAGAIEGVAGGHKGRCPCGCMASGQNHRPLRGCALGKIHRSRQAEANPGPDLAEQPDAPKNLCDFEAGENGAGQYLRIGLL
jgi:hypothetical protein